MGARALLLGRVTIRGLSNKLNLCCASHPGLSEQGHIPCNARISETSTCAGSKRETGNEIASRKAVDSYRRS
jgi:hypothetical protein